MNSMGLKVVFEATKNGKPFYREERESFNLDEEQFIEMEQDLFDVLKKWALKSGLK
jgi:hypothetical protein